ncbi:unnamed protein product, partial [Porites evermanni]
SGVFLVVATLVTALGNGLLLLAIWKDPFKTFRTPNTFFVIGLAVADFLTAGQFAHFISAATMNSSYIILLLFTWSQFTAINFPFKHKVLVTKSRVIASVILTWVYTVMFAILSASRVAETAFLKMDLYFHTTGSLLLLNVGYFCLYRAFKTQMRRLHSWKANHFLGKGQGVHRNNRRERQFTIVNLLLLTFVISCSLPVTVFFYLQYHWKDLTRLELLRLHLAGLFSNDVLFLKFALDPLIYAWRLAQYRRALNSLLVSTLVTALANGLLLLAIWKDPFKTFRTPNTFFVIGLAVADFLTGITACPLTAFQDIGLYISVKRRDSSIIPSLQKAGDLAHLISAATMNSSYIILLLFTWSQFTAINFPFKHKVLVTKSRVIASVILTWVYTVMFAILSASGV